MKQNNELERSDIVVLRDMEIDDESGQEIIAYLETWFDVDKKFGTDTASDDEKWLNLYAKYNPFADTLRLEYFISKDADCEEGEYTPTEAEAALIKEMVTEKIHQEYGQSPQEFCNYYNGIQTKKYDRRNVMTQEKYLKELDKLLAEIGSDDYYSSPEFQCDESGGFPVSLCVHWGKGKAWLEPNRKLSEEDSTLMNSVMDGIAEFGIRDCTNEEEYNEILKALGEDAYESAYLTTAEDSGMNMQ